MTTLSASIGLLPSMPKASEKRSMNAHSVQTHTRRNGNDIAPQPSLSLGERVSGYLRHRHPAKTADNVAADTGISVNTIKTWLQRASAPDAEGYTALWMAYGPDFLATLVDREPTWLKEVRRAEEAAHLKAEIAALQIKLSGVRA